jgi:hypothetical protein
MSLATLPAIVHEESLAVEVLNHLDEQLVAARGLLAVVLEQGAAIRERDVAEVVRQAGLLRGEMERRILLEEQRVDILARCGERLGIAPDAITLAEITRLMTPAAGELAMRRSGELNGLLLELQREHSSNRTLMQLELGFLDHLMGMLAPEGARGYDPHGSSRRITQPRPAGSIHVLDLRA